jgi:MFS family permease
MRALAEQMRRVAGLGRNAKLFLAMTAVSGLGNGMFQLFFNLFVLARGNDETFLGLVMSLWSLSALGLGLPMGILADRVGRKRSLLLGSVLSTLGVLTVVLSPLDWPLLVAAVVWGGGNAVYMATGPAFMAENAVPSQRSTLFSTHMGVMLLVSFAGSVIGGPLPAWFGSLSGHGPESASAYRATLLVSAIIMGLALIPLLMIRERSRSAVEGHAGLGLSLQALLRRDVLRLLVPQLVISLGAGLLIPYLNIFFKQRFAISDSLLGLAFGISQLGMGLATLVAPIFAERWGNVRTIVASELASLPFLLALGFVPVLPVAVGAFWLRATLMNMGGPLYIAFAMEQAEEDERGKLGAMLGLTWSVGRGIGPGISGVVQQQVGFTPLFLATGATYLVAALLLQVFFGGVEQRGEPGSLPAVSGTGSSCASG